MTRQIVCVGIAVLDEIFQVPELPHRPGKYRAAQRRVVGGGVAANAAVTVARLGGTATLLGAVGDDVVGAQIVADLEGHDVDVEGIRRVAGQASPVSAVLVDGAGERLIVNHAGERLFTDAAGVRPEEVANADVVLTDMRWPGGSIAAMGAAAAAGRPCVVDCDHDPADAPGILEAASHIVFALPTLQRYTGTADVAAALRGAAARTGSWVAATAGDDGVWWLDASTVRHGAADVVEVADTLAAGDVFHGAFALALAEERPPELALRWAAAAAAIKCKRFGGRDGIPMRNEVDAFVAERGPWH